MFTFLIFMLNTRHVCGLNVVFKPLALLCLFFSVPVFAQDTVLLHNIEVTAKKTELSQLGKKYEPIDSNIKQQFRFNSVADVLSFNTPVFVKSYGPGGVSTTAFRGGNASQTAVLWNGFNIQNSMLGQADLALLPSVLFETIDVEYGGSSSVFGSGAVGGSIHLNNKTPFNAGLITTTNFGGGSFGMKNASTRILFGKQRFVSSTKVYGMYSENNFKYNDRKNTEVIERTQKNAGYTFYGLMQEVKFLISARQMLTVNAWLNSNKRRLPAFDPLAESKTWQLDQAMRFTPSWNYVQTKFKSVVRAAFFSDIINYTDSLVPLFSKSRVNTVVAENENYFDWSGSHQLNVGVNVSSSSGTTNNYSGTKSQSRISFLAGNKFSYFRNRLLAYLSGRLDYFSMGKLPVTGNASLEYSIVKGLNVKINLARVYRQPTLNDLYWQPGGNPDLKAEQGFTQEGEINYKQQFGNFLVYFSGAAYSRKIDNWILWVSGPNGNPSPMNVQRVWSRGTETTWKLSYKKKKLTCAFGLVSGYVLATVESQSQENAGTLKKQLIYTPRYTINGNVSLGYGPLTLIYFHQYLGYRFTASDNSAWLDPYHLSSIRANFNLSIKQLGLNLFFACNNLLSTDYVVLASRSMPLRNYEFGISIQTKNNN